MDNLTNLEIKKAILHSEIDNLSEHLRRLRSKKSAMEVDHKETIELLKKKVNQAQSLAEQIDKINYNAMQAAELDKLIPKTKQDNSVEIEIK